MEQLSKIYQVGSEHVPANPSLSDYWAKKAEAARKKEDADSKK